MALGLTVYSASLASSRLAVADETTAEASHEAPGATASETVAAPGAVLAAPQVPARAASKAERASEAEPVPASTRFPAPTSFYIFQFLGGVSFTAAQVTLVWAIIERDEADKRNRLLIISGATAVTALAAVTVAGAILWRDNAKRARATAFVGPYGVGLRGTF